LPGAAVAVITKSIGLSETFKPKSERFIAPVCSVRIVHVPVKPVKGMVIGTLVIVPITFPNVSVSVPLIVPTALITPFVNEKLVVVRVPVKVPTPAITCMIAVVNDPVTGCAFDGTGIARNGKPTIIKAINTVRKFRRSDIVLLLKVAFRNEREYLRL
jgi:hypothetical protein